MFLYYSLAITPQKLFLSVPLGRFKIKLCTVKIPILWAHSGSTTPKGENNPFSAPREFLQSEMR